MRFLHPHLSGNASHSRRDTRRGTRLLVVDVDQQRHVTKELVQAPRRCDKRGEPVREYHPFACHFDSADLPCQRPCVSDGTAAKFFIRTTPSLPMAQPCYQDIQASDLHGRLRG